MEKRGLIKFIIPFVFLIVQVFSVTGQDEFIKLSGTVTDFDKNPVAYATVLIQENGRGTTTDSLGNFELRVPSGFYTLEVSHVGMDPYEKRTPAYRDTEILVKLNPTSIQMDEFVKTARPEDYRIKSPPGIDKLTFNDMKNTSFLMGVPDVVNAITLLPGVSTSGEGSTGFNVRGGKIDQNLVTLNRAEIFNSSHLLGFFSIFNADVVEDFTLYKGYLPAQFGGRTSSILNVTLKEGDYQTWDGSTTIGFATSQAYFEGPIIEDKLSIITSARFAYPNWLLNQARDTEVKKSEAGFNDQNLTIGYRFNDLNKLKFSLYQAGDRFQFGDDFAFGWNHFIAGLKLQNSLGDFLFHEFEINSVSFRNELEDLFFDYRIQNGMNMIGITDNWTYDGMENHVIDFGMEWKLYGQIPEERVPGSGSGFLPASLTKDQGWVLSGYFNDDWSVTEKLLISFGARYNLYNQIGDNEIFEYAEGEELNRINIVDTLQVNGSISSYQNFEPRIGLNYVLRENISLKASYNKVNQFVHLISNTTSATPVDQWQVSTPYIKPQESSNYSIGTTIRGPGKGWQYSMDYFYRDISRIYDYKDFADLILNEHIETELLEGEGKAYGLEVLVEKTKNIWTGWLSYTYSRSLNRISSPFQNLEINKGDWYPSNYDSPHNVSLVMNKDAGTNGFFSFNFIYKTGRPFTAVESNYLINGLVAPLYSERNQYRIPDYIRLDISFGLNSVVRGWDDKLTFSLYNLLRRDNAYSVYYRKPSDVAIVPFSYRLSVLGRTFPSVTYKVGFRGRFKQR